MSLGIQASVNKFAFLHVQDSSEDSDETGKPANNGHKQPPKKSGVTITNAKKKAKRRRKKNSNSASESTSQEEIDNQMKAWAEHDRNLVDELYNEDLKRALELSKVEFERIQTHQDDHNMEQTGMQSEPSLQEAAKSDDVPKKEKKKKNKVSKAISLEEFHQRIEQTVPLHEIEEVSREVLPSVRKSPTKKAQSNFFEEVENEAEYIKRNEHITEHYQALYDAELQSAKTEVCNKRDQRVHASGEKDKIIERLSKEADAWEKKFKHVKKRNQQLLFMLQQGEMKDKSELLLEVERLSVLRDELTSEVGSLNEQLEQERSRSRKLKDELLKIKKSHEESIVTTK